MRFSDPCMHGRANRVEGIGLAYVFENMVTALVSERRLVRVLDKYCPQIPGYFLYYPSRLNLPARRCRRMAPGVRKQPRGVVVEVGQEGYAFPRDGLQDLRTRAVAPETADALSPPVFAELQTIIASRIHSVSSTRLDPMNTGVRSHSRLWPTWTIAWPHRIAT